MLFARRILFAYFLVMKVLFGTIHGCLSLVAFFPHSRHSAKSSCFFLLLRRLSPLLEAHCVVSPSSLRIFTPCLRGREGKCFRFD